MLELGQTIANADGLLLVTPEYNNSIPGPFKNTIDWLSRIEDEAKPVLKIVSPAKLLLSFLNTPATSNHFAAALKCFSIRNHRRWNC